MIENIEKSNNEMVVFEGFNLNGDMKKETFSTIYGVEGSDDVKSLQLLNPGEDSPEGMEKFINWAKDKGLEVNQGKDGYTYTKHEKDFNETPVYKPSDEVED